MLAAVALGILGIRHAMPPESQLLNFVLTSFVIACIAGVATSFIWMTSQLVEGRALLPPWPEQPRLVPWGALSVVFVVLLLLVVQTSVMLIYYQTTTRETTVAKEARPAVSIPGGRAQGKLSFSEQLVLMSVSNAILLVAIPGALRVTSGAKLADFGLTADQVGSHVRTGLIAFFLATPMVMAVFALSQRFWDPNKHPLELMLAADTSRAGIVLAYVSAVVMAPLAEELLFRGVLQSWLRRLVILKRDRRAEQDLAAVAEPGGEGG